LPQAWKQGGIDGICGKVDGNWQYTAFFPSLAIAYLCMTDSKMSQKKKIKFKVESYLFLLTQ
jgi:hypothetical protein